MEFHFKPQGVCSKGIDIELDGDIIKSVKFTGGCNGIKCGFKKTSCPAQLALALEQAVSK